MCTRDRVSHHESGTIGGIVRWFTASSLCVSQRNLDHPKPDGRGINISGVDFWHAVEFSRNGRFLRTHPLGLSSGRFPSVFPFPTLSDLFDLISSVLSRSTLFAFPFPADPTLSEVPGRSDRPLLSDSSGEASSKEVFQEADRFSLSPSWRAALRLPNSRQLFESTSPQAPCQRLPSGR